MLPTHITLEYVCIAFAFIGVMQMWEWGMFNVKSEKI